MPMRSKRSPPPPEDIVYNPFTTNPTPLNESPVERENRLRRAREAQKRSHAIDAEIAESKKAFDRKAKAVKILLLGQAESGKSTVLKNFQIAFTPNHFSRQRAVWRTVIQLNLIKSIKTILDALQEEWGPAYASPPPNRSYAVTSTHRRIRMGLSPLLAIETSLTRMLSPSSVSSSTAPRELSVQAGSAWQNLLDTSASTSPYGQQQQQQQKHSMIATNGGRPRSARSFSEKSSQDITHVLAACRQDIITLWEDEAVREVLKNRELNLHASSGFFLDDTARIATTTYEPSDADIVRARIRTMGVEEHRFLMETADAGSEYYIFDVGGSRGMRPQWIPFFENVDAILFLAPLAFNEVLEEDPRVNRLEDSLCLWREICSHRLLAETTIILFLNKMDVLHETLASGVVVKKYVPSYGDQPNDMKNVIRYFKAKFKAYHKRLSPKPRPFMCHETSAIDTRSTVAMLDGVREAILRSSLKKMAVI